ncbi:hypothetical protein D3C78_1987400 [compost metagenome]
MQLHMRHAMPRRARHALHRGDLVRNHVANRLRAIARDLAPAKSPQVVKARMRAHIYAPF